MKNPSVTSQRAVPRDLTVAALGTMVFLAIGLARVTYCFSPAYADECCHIARATPARLQTHAHPRCPAISGEKL